MNHRHMNSSQTVLSRVVFLLLVGFLGLASCESDSERRHRWEQELKSEEERAKLQAEAEERARQEAEALRMRQAEEAQRLLPLIGEGLATNQDQAANSFRDAETW